MKKLITAIVIISILTLLLSGCTEQEIDKEFKVTLKEKDVEIKKEGGLISLPMKIEDLEEVQVLTDRGEYRGTVYKGELKFIANTVNVDIINIEDITKIESIQVDLKKEEFENSGDMYLYKIKNDGRTRGLEMYYHSDVVEFEIIKDEIIYTITEDMHKDIDNLNFTIYKLVSLL